MSFPTSQETESSVEFQPVFALDTVSFLQRQVPIAEKNTTLSEADIFDASQILTAAKLDERSRNYFNGLSGTEKEGYEKAIAMLKKKQNTDHDEDENYEKIEPSEFLDYILTLTRRDEFMQVVAAATMQADLQKKALALSPDDPKRPQSLRNPAEYGFKSTEEMINFMDFNDEESQKMITKLSTFVDKEKEDVRKSAARSALRAFSFFNFLYPTGDIRRPSMLRKLGLPSTLPYLERRPAADPDEVTMKGILPLIGNKVQIPLSA